MILKRSTNINLTELNDEFQKYVQLPGLNTPLDTFSQWIELQQVCNAAISEISTKLEILDDEFQIHYKHNPIHHMECRLKSFQSISNKVNKLNIPKNIQSIKENIKDIAGIRIICNYLDDIYTIEQLLVNQQDIELLGRKDYIKTPKESGYRSLHLIISVPVFLSTRTEIVPVEIQLRTIAMDYWASLEHKLRYKAKSDTIDRYKDQLVDCATQLAAIEDTMKNIHTELADYVE